MSSSVLPLFWNLASASQDTRLAASADLVSSLQTSQAAFSQNAEAGPSALRNGHSVNGFSKDTDEDDEDEDESDEDVDMSDATEDAADNQAAEKQFAKQNASDVVYAVKRLLRGLASSRESSRLGFAVALTEVSSSIIWQGKDLIGLTDPISHTNHLHDLCPIHLTTLDQDVQIYAWS